MARRSVPRPAQPDAADPVASAAQHMREGRHAAAAAALIPALLVRAADGDVACGIAADLLRRDLCLPPAADATAALPVMEDHLTRAVERLAHVARQQDEQVSALLDLMRDRS